jgi:hypothetical protein
MRTMRFTLLPAAALAFLITLTSEAHGNQIEGLWDVVVWITDCASGAPAPVPPIRAMITFTRDGKVIETAGTPLLGPIPIQRVSPGLGTWQHLGQRHFTAAFTFFRINVPPTAAVPFSFAGTQTITEDIELSHDGNEFSAIGTSQIVNADGTKPDETCNSLAGVRRP